MNNLLSTSSRVAQQPDCINVRWLGKGKQIVHYNADGVWANAIDRDDLVTFTQLAHSINIREIASIYFPSSGNLSSACIDPIFQKAVSSSVMHQNSGRIVEYLMNRFSRNKPEGLFLGTCRTDSLQGSFIQTPLKCLSDSNSKRHRVLALKLDSQIAYHAALTFAVGCVQKEELYFTEHPVENFVHHPDFDPKVLRGIRQYLGGRLSPQLTLAIGLSQAERDPSPSALRNFVRHSLFEQKVLGIVRQFYGQS